MGKKYKQNQEGLKQLKEESVILGYLLNETEPNRVYTKQELMNITGMSERKVRLEIERIANFYPVRASAGGVGYSIIVCGESVESLRAANEEAFAQICEIQNRINSLKARLKPLIALMHVTALKLQEKEQNKENE